MHEKALELKFGSPRDYSEPQLLSYKSEIKSPKANEKSKYSQASEQPVTKV
jgi:hypothetical protein